MCWRSVGSVSKAGSRGGALTRDLLFPFLEAWGGGGCLGGLNQIKQPHVADFFFAYPLGFVVYRRVGKKSHGTETSRVLTFFSHMQSRTPAPNFNNVPRQAAELATVLGKLST